jgi:hypothetical protein
MQNRITTDGTAADSSTKADDTTSSQTITKPNVSGWVSVNDELPETLEVVWISNGKGWTTLGCRSDYFNDIGEDGKEQLFWCWCASNGIIWEEEGKITSECEGDDYDVQFWHRLPVPPCR